MHRLVLHLHHFCPFPEKDKSAFCINHFFLFFSPSDSGVQTLKARKPSPRLPLSSARISQDAKRSSYRQGCARPGVRGGAGPVFPLHGASHLERQMPVQTTGRGVCVGGGIFGMTGKMYAYVLRKIKAERMRRVVGAVISLPFVERITTWYHVYLLRRFHRSSGKKHRLLTPLCVCACAHLGRFFLGKKTRGQRASERRDACLSSFFFPPRNDF